MTDPHVLCVMLTADRPELTRRAIADWRLQTYQNKTLLVFDTGDSPLRLQSERQLVYMRIFPYPSDTVGHLRNLANWFKDKETELIAHFDSDDWSAPFRLEHQVKALAAFPTADVAGYGSMVYWSTVPGMEGAWLYSHPSPRFVLGGSMLYRRSAWQRKPFTHGLMINGKWHGEDTEWIKGLRVVRCRGVDLPMIARYHGRNTACRITEGVNTGNRDGAGRFRRAPEYDDTCLHLLGDNPVQNPVDKQ